MRLLLLTSLLFVGTVSPAYGEECPWTNKKAIELMQFDYHDAKVTNLSSEQVKQDLACLKILLATHYSLNQAIPNNEIVSKLDAVARNAEPMTNVSLLEKIFDFHKGYVDLHLSYQSHGVEKRFTTIQPVLVTVSEELNHEQIYERDSFTYFKPGSLGTNLSEGQSRFIEYVKRTDRPLVIDLRGNGGGDNTFAKALSESLFAPSQHIPVSKIVQIESPLRTIGHCVTTYIVYGNAIWDRCIQMVSQYQNLEFSELIQTTISKREEKYVGVRKTEFNSQIVMITDSGCASACETIVEKLLGHPRAKTIGAHTMGALAYSNAISFTLPNSGIWVRIPTRLEIYEKATPEGLGYFPSVTTSHVVLQTL